MGSKYAILMDTERCTGCRGCQVSCKKWYELPYTETELSDSWTNPPDLNPSTFMHVRLVEKGEDETISWTFYRWACLHCEDPPCAAVCPVDAITKFAEGPVVIDQGQCIGCQWCVYACPFGVMKFDTDVKKAYKCTMCADRISQGSKPQCVETCPVDALQFGERGEILKKARERASKIGGHVYGDKEIGGTTYFIVTKQKPTDVGMPQVSEQQPPGVTFRSIKNVALPLTEVAVGAVIVAGILKIVQRRKERTEAEAGTP